MTDYYTSVCFAVPVTDSEAALILEVVELCDQLDNGFVSPDAELARYAASSEALRTMFPATDPAKPFAALLGLFDDPTYPHLAADLSISDQADGVGKILDVKGCSVDPWEIANLVRILAPSALPFSFGYAHTASRDRYDAYGGGYIEVRRDKLVEMAGCHEDTDDQHMVIATIDPGEGLLFWNNHDGFGSLEAATVFAARDAANIDLPVADNQPQWLALPPRHAFFKEQS